MKRERELLVIDVYAVIKVYTCTMLSVLGNVVLETSQLGTGECGLGDLAVGDWGMWSWRPRSFGD